VHEDNLWVASFAEPYGACYASTAAEEDDITLRWQDERARFTSQSVVTPRNVSDWIRRIEGQMRR